MSKNPPGRPSKGPVHRVNMRMSKSIAEKGRELAQRRGVSFTRLVEQLLLDEFAGRNREAPELDHVQRREKDEGAKFKPFDIQAWQEKQAKLERLGM